MPPKLPTGRLRRAMSVARVGARAGASILVSKGTEKAASHAADVLGNLRGLAAKLGQTASYVDGLIPPEHRETYEKALGELQRRTVTSSTSDIRELVETELDAPVDRLFLEWSEEPVASASIGQVHRARLHDGTEVAVKVQHPDIEQAIEGDLKNIGMLEGVVTFAGPRGFRAKPIFEEVIQRFREELDYHLEASHQTAFRELHRDDAMIHIPRVIHERSSRRVLTSEWVSGATLEEAAQASEATRRVYAEVLWRFVFRGNLVGGRFNADPHPGNYLFNEDGSVTFLDFGCVQPIAEPLRKAAVDVHRAAVARDDASFREAIDRLLGTRGGAFGRATYEYTRACFEPVFESPYHLTRDYAASLFRRTKTLKAEMYAKDGSFVPPPPDLAFMNRLQFGFYSVLARLDVEVDYAQVERTFLDEAADTESGRLEVLSKRLSNSGVVPALA